MADDAMVDTVALATELTIAWLGNPNTRAGIDEVPEFLKSMHQAVAGLEPEAAPVVASEPMEEHRAAVSVRKSLADPNFIISMIDGKPYRTLRRHLSGHGLTPQEYRARYNLKADYPMVAPTYSDARRAMAKKFGLGRKAADAVEMVAEAAKPAARKGRRTAAGALKAAKAALGTE